MAEIIEFSTERLRLRQWAPQDREPFAAMNADPEVMKYFASVATREGSFRTIDVWQSELEERGWSNWAVEHVESRAFIGFVGLSYLAGPCPSCRASRLAASGEELLGQGFCHRGREGVATRSL